VCCDWHPIPTLVHRAVTTSWLSQTPYVKLAALRTKPPPRYTEATLLSAMEGAGKLIDDDELREAMQEKGLGTPATRAAIIEGLIYEKYIHREGRELVPGAKAFQLMTLLRGLGVEDLTKPELTGNWEYQLAEMEHGRLKREQFMAEIAKMAERIVRKAKEYDRDTIPGDYATLTTPCPNCGVFLYPLSWAQTWGLALLMIALTLGGIAAAVLLM
jgi:DNA topoisomerase-3